MIGLALSAPPDGLTATSSPMPMASRRISSWWRERGVELGDVEPAGADAGLLGGDAWPTATSVRSRQPRAIGSMRWSMPRIHAGRSQRSRAKSPAAMIMAAAPSVIGGQSLLRSGSTIGSSARRSSTDAVPRQLGVGVVEGVAAAAGGHLGHVAPRSNAPGLEAGAGLQGGEADRRRATAGPTLYGSSWRVSTSCDRARRRLAVAVDQGGVELAELELHPRLVEGEGAVHLDVALLDRRPRADAVEGHDEAEPDAGEVVGGARAGEADVVLGDVGRSPAPPRGPA